MAKAEKITSDKLLLLLKKRGIFLTDRRLRQLADDNFFPPPQQSEYEFLETLLGLIEHYHKLREKQGGSLAQVKLLTAQADLRIKEVEAATRESKVADVGEVERSRIALVTFVQQRLLGLPAKLTARIAAFTTAAQIQSALETEIADVLENLSQPVFIARPDSESEDGGRE